MSAQRLLRMFVLSAGHITFSRQLRFVLNFDSALDRILVCSRVM